MKLNLKDIIIIAIISVISFPLVYFVMLLVTGNAKIVLTNTPLLKKESSKELMVMKQNQETDSLLLQQSQIYMSAETEKKKVEEERKKLIKQQERISFVHTELENQKNQLQNERKKLEDLVNKSNELETKKIKKLAKVYAAMRPQEAASILETLSDKLCLDIINAINDDRQKAKIMSMVSAEKASRMSKSMGQSLTKAP